MSQEIENLPMLHNSVEILLQTVRIQQIFVPIADQFSGNFASDSKDSTDICADSRSINKVILTADVVTSKQDMTMNTMMGK